LALKQNRSALLEEAMKSVRWFSHEINRLLGTALLDPDFQARVLSKQRVELLDQFELSRDERRAVLQSEARTLRDLAKDLSIWLTQSRA
jgi:hypothetical protein